MPMTAAEIICPNPGAKAKAPIANRIYAPSRKAF
jgi:hypothetical protein